MLHKNEITRRKQKKENAYMTLEASLVYPLIFGGILFTISLALYLYNAAVVRQVSSVAALRGSLEVGISEKETKSLVNTELDKLIKERLFFVSTIKKEVKVTETKINVRLKVKVNLPMIKIPLLDFRWDELEFENQAKRVKTVKIIRDTRRLYGS